MTKTCPSCSQPAEGRFCSHCGSALEGAACAECGSALPPGGRFCNQCGAPAGAARTAEHGPAAPAAPSRLPWALAGGAVVALLVLAVALWPRLQGSDPDPAAQAQAGAPASGNMPSAEEIAAMDPREAADRLFERVMTAVSAGDSAQAQMFLPMALTMYERVPELDLDARYHVAALQLVAQDPEAARAEAARILEAHPDHLLGLLAAAEAESAAGDQEASVELYRRFLDRYDAEVARQLPEYQAHAPVLAAQREEARQRVAGA